jgi:hypothetical protein
MPWYTRVLADYRPLGPGYHDKMSVQIPGYENQDLSKPIPWSGSLPSRTCRSAQSTGSSTSG